jgi:hypothetical protein
MPKKHYFLSLLALPLLGLELEISELEATYLLNGKQDYTITSKAYINHFNSAKLGLFLNREQFMLENNFYKDGFIEFSNSRRLYFKKAYKFGGKVYLFDISGKINNAEVVAKKAIYFKTKLTLKHCEIKTSKKILRRRNYTMNLSK